MNIFRIAMMWAVVAGVCWGQNSAMQSAPLPRSDSGTTSSNAQEGPTQLKPGEAPPPSTPLPANESSSRTTILDLSPPLGEAQTHPNSAAELEGGGVSELQPWDPHRAAKDNEVGEYYFKQENYRGAKWRFEDALKYKPNDAEATFRLAQVYEKTGERAKAADFYRSYLKILPYGPFAADAHKALEKLSSGSK